jgi:hypothetical protein
MPLIINGSGAGVSNATGPNGSATQGLNAGLKQHTLAGSAYGFSGVRIDDLGASEYTLAVIAADTSGSVGPFVRHIEATIGAVVQACGRSPRADNLMLRLLSFDDTVTEVHGFRALAELDPAAYHNTLKAGGCTALFDAALNAVASATHYGEQLVRHAFGVNAIVFVITDGCDNRSTAGLAQLTEAVNQARHAERLESLATVLIGVNLTDDTVKTTLAQLAQSAGFTQFIAMDQADARSLARVADFVSQCVSVQSACLGSGQGPSLPVLTF